jgi:hypothetical protein
MSKTVYIHFDRCERFGDAWLHLLGSCWHPCLHLIRNPTESLPVSAIFQHPSSHGRWLHRGRTKLAPWPLPQRVAAGCEIFWTGQSPHAEFTRSRASSRNTGVYQELPAFLSRGRIPGRRSACSRISKSTMQRSILTQSGKYLSSMRPPIVQLITFSEKCICECPARKDDPRYNVFKHTGPIVSFLSPGTSIFDWATFYDLPGFKNLEQATISTKLFTREGYVVARPL